MGSVALLHSTCLHLSSFLNFALLFSRYIDIKINFAKGKMSSIYIYTYIKQAVDLLTGFDLFGLAEFE